MTSSEAALNDEELIKTLQYLGRVTKDYDQEQMVGADYEMIPTITKQAADRIEALVKERDDAEWNTRAVDPATIREAALREAYKLMQGWTYCADAEEEILDLIGEKK